MKVAATLGYSGAKFPAAISLGYASTAKPAATPISPRQASAADGIFGYDAAPGTSAYSQPPCRTRRHNAMPILGAERSLAEHRSNPHWSSTSCYATSSSEFG